MKRIYRDRLNKLANFLEALPTRKLKMHQWVTKRDKKGCGTVCCAAGWCPAVFPRQWKWRNFEAVLRQGSVDWNLLDAQKFFGLDYEQAGQLFLTSRYGTNNPRKSTVIARIREQARR